MKYKYQAILKTLPEGEFMFKDLKSQPSAGEIMAMRNSGMIRMVRKCDDRRGHNVAVWQKVGGMRK